MDFAELGAKVDMRDFERANRTLDTFDKSTSKAEQSALRFFKAIAAGFSIRELIQFSDTWTSVNNQIKLVTDSAAEFARVQAGVVEVSKASNTELTATASLYSTLARYSGDLVKSDSELLRITETLNKSFAVSGASADSQAGAIRQLSQALASGALRGDEFNSVNENAPRIMDAIAASLNMTKGELREFAAEGGITSEIIINAVKGMADEIDRDFAEMDKTFAQYVTNARTNATQFIGESQTVSTAVSALGGTILALSENLDLVSTALVAVAAVMAARFIGSVVSATSAIVAQVAAQVTATTVTNVWGQRIVTATAAQNAMALASRGLGAAMAFLGGPAGIITLAAAGLYLWFTRAEEAYQPSTDLAQSVEDLAGSFRDLGEAQRDLAMLEIGKDIANANAAITEQQGVIQRLLNMRERFGDSTKIQEQLVIEQAELEKLGGDLAKLAQVRAEYQSILDGNTQSEREAAESAARMAEEAKKVIDALKQQIAMLSMTEREAFIYKETLKLGEDATADLVAQTRQLAGDLFDQTEAQKAATKAQEDATRAAADYRSNVKELVDSLMPFETATREIAASQDLLFQAMIDGIITGQEYMAGMAAIDQQMKDLKDSTTELSKESKELQTVYTRSIERIRDVIGNFFQEILTTGELTFSGLLDGFKRLIAEMIATAAANRIVIGIGLGGASGAASASGGILGSIAGNGGLSGMLGNLTNIGGLLNSAGTLFSDSVIGLGQLLGGKAGQAVFDLYGNMASLGSSMGLSGGASVLGGGLATAGIGYLGGQFGTAAGEALFGKQAESAWGATLGGILGTMTPLGPIGTALGSIFGGALDAAFGGDGRERVTLGVETDPYAQAGGRGFTDTQIRGASGLLYTGRATRADEEAANDLAKLFAGIDDTLTMFVEATTGRQLNLAGRSLAGASSQAGLAVQDSGRNSFFGSAEFNELNQQALTGAARQFMLSWFDEVEKAMGESLPIARILRGFEGTDDQFLGLVDALGALQTSGAIEHVADALARVERFQGGAEELHAFTASLVALLNSGVIQDTGASFTAVMDILEHSAGSAADIMALGQSLGGLLITLERNPVGTAMDEFNRAQMTMIERYTESTLKVRDLSVSFDGSLTSTQALTAALADQQQVAYELTAAYLQAQSAVSGLFGGLSESIRTSMMTDEQLYEYQRNQVHALTSTLSMLTDPQSILATSQDIERRVSDMWGRLDEAQREAMGADYLAYVEETARIAQERLQAGLDTVKVTQDDINETIRQGIEDAAARMSGAAATQEAAASMFAAAVDAFASAAATAATMPIRSAEATG